MTPRTSVIMPAYNSHATVREAVLSVLGQTAGELELIVVDDGSDPPISEALAGIDDARMRVLRRDRNGGTPAAARNAALATVETTLVSQLDSDDLWEPRYLERVLPQFDDELVGLTYTNAHIIEHPAGHDTYVIDASVHPMDTFPKIAEQNPIPSLTVTMRTRALKAVGGYPRWLSIGEDYFVWMSLARAGWRFAYVDEKLASYRWPRAERGISFDQRRSERDALKMYAGFALRHPLTPGPKRQVRARVAQELRRLRGR